MIRAILFDLDGTLVDRDEACRRYGFDLMLRRPDVFPPARRAASLRALLEPASGNRVRNGWARRLVSAFPELGTVEDLAADFASRMGGFVAPDEATIRMVESLKRRYVLGVVSNGAGPVQRAKLDAAGLSGLFEAVLVSAEERASKPHPALFRRALDRVGSLPSQTLFVGDDPSLDVAAAARVGMSTCWVSRGRDYPAGVARPDRTVRRVHDLLETLA